MNKYYIEFTDGSRLCYAVDVPQQAGFYNGIEPFLFGAGTKTDLDGNVWECGMTIPTTPGVTPSGHGLKITTPGGVVYDFPTYGFWAIDAESYYFDNLPFGDMWSSSTVRLRLSSYKDITKTTAGYPTWIRRFISDNFAYLSYIEMINRDYYQTESYWYIANIESISNGIYNIVYHFRSDGSFTHVGPNIGLMFNVYLDAYLPVNIFLHSKVTTTGDIRDATVTLNPSSYTYTGEPCTPAVTVTLNGNQLTEGTDYTKTYINNINIGTASVQLAGIGNYGGTKTVNFTIGAPDISNATVLLTPSVYWYNSEACEPHVDVILDNVQLTEGTEYTKTYTNNINPGTASVTIAGISPYIGSQTITFTIEKRSVTQADINVYPLSFRYDGLAKRPSVTVTCDGHQLTENTDYTVTYANNVEPGTATCTITAEASTNWITGSASVPFNIFDNSGTDPYAGGGISQTDLGGQGDFSTISDVIAEPDAPNISVADAGFCRIYNPNLSQLKSLAQYMWTDTTFLNTIINHAKQLFENPMESIIALNLLPCAISHGTDEVVKVMFTSTNVSMPPVTDQFPVVNCGTCVVEKRYDSALDYSPYTQVSCFLPFIGTVTFDTDEVMGKTLGIKYHIDVATGVCVACVSVDGSVLYQYSGHCASAQPLTGADFMTYVGAALQSAKMIGGVIAAGTGHPALAAELVGGPRFQPETVQQTITDTTQNGREPKHVESQRIIPARGMSTGELAAKAVSNSVAAVMGSKTTIQHTSGFSGASGFLGERRPYLIIKRPRDANPDYYSKFNGRPAMIYMQLSACSGYTEVQSVQLTDIPATNMELSEISELLKSGVIF